MSLVSVKGVNFWNLLLFTSPYLTGEIKRNLDLTYFDLSSLEKKVHPI
jgi:hypothetical protein